MFRQSERCNILLVTGLPLDLNGLLDERLDRAVSGDSKIAAKELKELDGAFAAIHWDFAQKKLLIVSDPLGLQPLYIAHTKQGVLLATELKAFPASGMMEINMDPAGWGAFVGLAYAIEDRTQLAGVRRFPPATVTRFDPATGGEDSEEYWQWPTLREDLKLEDVDTGAIIDVFRAELAAYAQHARGKTVLLSGGFDSRLTLALMHQEGWNPSTLILGHQDELWGADAKLALACVKRLGVPWALIKTPRNFYRTSSYLDYLVMNEVTTPSLYLFIAQVQAYIDSSMQVVWDGTPPGYGLVPAFLPPGGFELFIKESCRPRNAFVWRIAEETFGRAKTDEMYEELSASIRREVAKYPDDEMGVTMFEVYNRMRNRTTPNSLKGYSNKVLPYMLGVSRIFWDMAGQIPYSVTKAYELYFEIYRRHFPRLANIPFLSGGQLWCDRTCGLRGTAARALYCLAKIKPIGLSQKAYRRYIRGSRKYWMDSQFLLKTRERMELDHPDLNADNIRKMDVDHRLPFYWQMWRWVLSGELTTWNSHTFFGESIGPVQRGRD
jgi:hypothetical protein